MVGKGNHQSELFMVVTLFRSRLTNQAGDDYHTMSAEMLARAKDYPGYVAMKSFAAEDGERLTVVWWENEDLLLAWRRDARHMQAQKLGRERWYHYYHMEIATVVRESQFVRQD
jgi:heme-degrading monooxygenase HmoA